MLRALGIDPTYLAAGGAGGVLRALSRRRFKLREMFASPICGMLAAAYMTPAVVHYVKVTGWPVPESDQQFMLASAFLIGTCAMWLADIVLEVIVRRFRPLEDDEKTR